MDVVRPDHYQQCEEKKWTGHQKSYCHSVSTCFSLYNQINNAFFKVSRTVTSEISVCPGFLQDVVGKNHCL